MLANRVRMGSGRYESREEYNYLRIVSIDSHSGNKETYVSISEDKTIISGISEGGMGNKLGIDIMTGLSTGFIFPEGIEKVIYNQKRNTIRLDTIGWRYNRGGDIVINYKAYGVLSEYTPLDVQNMISGLPKPNSIRLSHENDVREVRANLDNLTEEQYEEVGNKRGLYNREASLRKLGVEIY